MPPASTYVAVGAALPRASSLTTAVPGVHAANPSSLSELGSRAAAASKLPHQHPSRSSHVFSSGRADAKDERWRETRNIHAALAALVCAVPSLQRRLSRDATLRLGRPICGNLKRKSVHVGRQQQRCVAMSALNLDEPPPPDSEFPEGAIWNWGEIYVWGGVTYTPGVPLESFTMDGDVILEQELVSEATEQVALLADAGATAWRAVEEQYPVAVRGGKFAGKPINPELASDRFSRLVGVLKVKPDEALELVKIDSTPLLVDPDGVANAFELLVGISYQEKALELVRCHPGLLVGGATTSLKTGVSAVTTILVDGLLAGRLRRVLEDNKRDKKDKLAEIEFYAQAAHSFKPIMDLMQRRSMLLSAILMLISIPVFGGLFSTAKLTDFGIGPEEEQLLALTFCCGSWAYGVVTWGINTGIAWTPSSIGLLLQGGASTLSSAPWLFAVAGDLSWPIWFLAGVLTLCANALFVLGSIDLGSVAAHLLDQLRSVIN